MRVIKNYDKLALSAARKLTLELIEAAYEAIMPSNVLNKQFLREGEILKIGQEQLDLAKFKRVFLIGFGKGSGGISQVVEQVLGDNLTKGYVIDNIETSFTKLDFTLGTHPLPSQINLDFTQKVLEQIKDLNSDDLVLLVICGGGSAMFESPYKLTLPRLMNFFDAMLKSGANIAEMNIVRKHLSRVKGGGIAKHLYPARIVSMLFSDVPGSDLGVIASGPTVRESSTKEDVLKILSKYNLSHFLTEEDLSDLPTEEKYFTKVSNELLLSNKTALRAMQEVSQRHNISCRIVSDHLQGDAKEIGSNMLAQAINGFNLYGGETTLKVSGKGKGGRNQTVVLAALPYLRDNELIASFASDGIDYYGYAGAIGDSLSKAKAKVQGIDTESFLKDDNSYEFFVQIEDGIETGRLEANVSDLMIVYKYV